jgi:transposase
MPNFMDAAYYTMDVFKAEQFSSSHIGHLGLVADKIDSLNLIDLIDRRLPISTPHGAKVSYGERVAAMILNGLGFIRG